MVPKLQCARFQYIERMNNHNNSILIGFPFVASIKEYFLLRWYLQGDILNISRKKSNPFSAAMRKPMGKVSRDMTIDYVICVGTSVRLPPTMYQDFLIKSILKSNTK